MKQFNMEAAIKRYNGIMETIGYEFNTIGKCHSESTEDWNIRDMVAECDYTLSTYFEHGHGNNDLRYGDEDEQRMWRSETHKLRRFIRAYLPYIHGVKCTTRHCSMYDN